MEYPQYLNLENANFEKRALTAQTSAKPVPRQETPIILLAISHSIKILRDID